MSMFLTVICPMIGLILGLWIGVRWEGKRALDKTTTANETSRRRKSLGVSEVKTGTGSVWSGPDSLGQIAHEMRGPTSALISSLDTLAKSLQRTRTHENETFSTVSESALATANLAAHQLKDLARELHTAEESISPTSIATKDLIDAALKLTQHDMTEIVVTRKEGSGLVVSVVPGAIVRVIVNLLTNASKSLQGRGEVAITTRVEGGNVEILVSDSGKGVPDTAAKQIFQPGFSEWRSGASGDGHGLALCQRTVESHGGSLTLLPSGPLSGATFAILLPAGTPESSGADWP